MSSSANETHQRLLLTPWLAGIIARPDLDELLLYLAVGSALGASLLAAGWASGSVSVGVLGALLIIAGVWMSWHTRQLPPDRRVLFGSIAAVVAAGSLHGVIRWQIAHEVGNINAAEGDVGLSLALRMAVMLVALSFLLIRRELLPFTLVPGVTLFGLAGGRGVSSVAFGCFLAFLPAALIALGQAMLLTGGRESIRASNLERDEIMLQVPHSTTDVSWRRRYLSLLAILIAVILGLGTLIYIPVVTYGTQYYWPLAMMSFSQAPFGFIEPGRFGQDGPRTYVVGQGPISPTGAPVLSYSGDPVPLWRGEVFDIYTGAGWRSSDQDPIPVRPLDGGLDIGRFFPPTSRSALVTHEFRVESNLPVVFYGDGQIEQVKISRQRAALIPGGIFVDKFGCISAPRGLFLAGTRYQVASDSGAYRSLSERPSRVSLANPIETSILEPYLGLPLSSRRVADLARKLTAGAESTNQKVQSLVSYLQQECVYTFAAPAVPRGQDAAEFFLFTSKRGYCDLFATTFAVMARAAGIPARFVIGYAEGQYDASAGRYMLRESDAHAWVEIYDPASGWLTVDATPGTGPVTLSPLQQLVAAVQVFARNHHWTGAAVAGVIALITLIIFLAVASRRAERAHLALDRNDPRTIVLRAYSHFTRILARRGRPRYVNQTPLEYLEAVGRSCDSASMPEQSSRRLGRWLNPAILPAARSLTELFLLARYSPHPISPEAASLALGHLDQATEALHRRKR